MRRRKLLLGAVAGLLVLAGVAALALRPRPSQITEENFARVKKGMTRAEVESLFGPPRDDRTGPCGPVLRGRFMPDGVTGLLLGPEGTPPPIRLLREHGFWVSVWQADGVEIVVVGFDGVGVMLARYQTVARMEQAALDALRWRLRRQWERWVP